MKKEHPRETFIFAPNHETYTDGPILYLYLALIRRCKVSFITKKEVIEHSALWRFFLNLVPHIVIPDNDPGAAVKATVKMLKKGYSMIIFPEGTTFKKHYGYLALGKSGAIRIALEAKVSIIPVGFFYAGQRRPLKFIRKIVFGEPVKPKAFKNYEELRFQTDSLMQKIAKLCGRKYDPERAMKERQISFAELKKQFEEKRIEERTGLKANTIKN